MLIPSKGRLVVEEIQRKDTQTASGLHLPGELLQQENLLFGKVISTTSDEFPEGTQVFYSRYSASMTIDSTGKKRFIIPEADVMGIDNDIK